MIPSRYGEGGEKVMMKLCSEDLAYRVAAE